jgi:hypothetical protein
MKKSKIKYQKRFRKLNACFNKINTYKGQHLGFLAQIYKKCNRGGGGEGSKCEKKSYNYIFCKSIF